MNNKKNNFHHVSRYLGIQYDQVTKIILWDVKIHEQADILEPIVNRGSLGEWRGVEWKCSEVEWKCSEVE